MPVNPCFAKYFPQLVKADRDLIRDATQEYIKKGMEEREAATRAVQDKLDVLDADKRRIHEELISKSEKLNPELVKGLREKYAPEAKKEATITQLESSQEPSPRKTGTGGKEETVTLYRGEYTGNKGGQYYSPDKEWARQFTQSGKETEVKSVQLPESEIYRADKLPFASDEKSFDVGVAEAKKQGFKAMWVDEGQGEPNSVYVIDKTIFKQPLPRTGTGGKPLEDAAIKKYGTTTIPESASFITADGKFIDSSGKKLGSSGEGRNIDHRQIAVDAIPENEKTKGMSGDKALRMYMQETGDARITVTPTDFNIDIAKPLTDAQLASAKKLAKGKTIYGDVTDAEGQPLHSGMFKNFSDYEKFLDVSFGKGRESRTGTGSQPLYSFVAGSVLGIQKDDEGKWKYNPAIGLIGGLGGIALGMLSQKALGALKEIEGSIAKKGLNEKLAAREFASEVKNYTETEGKAMSADEKAEMMKLANPDKLSRAIALGKQEHDVPAFEKPAQVTPPSIEKTLDIRPGQSKNWLQKFGFKVSDADAILKARGPFGQPFLREPTPKGEMPRELKLSWIDPKQKIDTDIKGLSDFADYLHGKDVPLFNKAFDKLERTAKLARKTLSPGVVFRHVFKDAINNPINDALEAQQSSFVNRKEGEAFVAKALQGVSSSRRTIDAKLQKLKKEYFPIYGDMLAVSYNDGGRMKVREGFEEEAGKLWDKMQPLLEQRDALIKELARTNPDVRIYLMAEDPKAAANLPHATPFEKKAAENIRNYLNGPVKESLQKVGIKTLGEDKIYLTHLLDREDFPSLNIGQFDYIPEDFQFKHRELAGKSWMPSIVEATKAYVPRMSRMVSWNPFVNKWGPFMKYMTDHPDVRSYFEDWLGSNYYDKGKGTTAALFDHAVNGYVEFEALRLLGGSLSSAKSHAFKVAGNIARAPMPVFLQSMARTLGSVLNIIPSKAGWTERSLGQKLAQEFVARRSLHRMIDEVPTDQVNKLYDAAQKYSNTIAPVEWFENVNDALGTVISSSNAGLDPIATRQFLWDTISRFNFRGGVDQPMAMKQAPYRAVFQFQMTPWKIKEMQANLIMEAIKAKKDPVGDAYAMKLFRYISAVGIITTLGYKAGYNLLDYFTHIPLTRMGAGGLELGPEGLEVSEPKFAVTPAVQLAYDMGQKGIFTGAMKGSAVASDMTKAVTPLAIEKLARIKGNNIPKIYQDDPWRYLLSLPTMEAQEEAKKNEGKRPAASPGLKSRPGGSRTKPGGKKIASNDYLGMLAGENG